MVHKNGAFLTSLIIFMVLAVKQLSCSPQQKLSDEIKKVRLTSSNNLAQLIDAFIEAKTTTKIKGMKALEKIGRIPPVQLADLEPKSLRTRSQKNGEIPSSAALHNFFLRGRASKMGDEMSEMGLTHMRALKMASQRIISSRLGGEPKLRSSNSVKFPNEQVKVVVANLLRTRVNATVMTSNCPEPEPCDPNAKYRRVDGSCNNLEQPKFGWIHTPFQRILPNSYSDGLDAFRKDRQGSELPNARKVSATLSRDQELDSTATSILTTFGQFVDHDITRSPAMKGIMGMGLDCCSISPLSLENDVISESCAPIWIDPGDEVFKSRCMNFVRSTRSVKLDCTPSASEQQNELTDWLDLSHVYGIDEPEADEIKTGGFDGFPKGKKGHIQVKDPDYESRLSLNNICTEEGCWFIGDVRGLENPQLSMFHAIFIKLHNLLATQLSSLNPHWDDEVVFQEARRLNIAIYQHIIYQEYLPTVMGRGFAYLYDLLPRTGNRYYDKYDSKLDPRITNEFATGAFRFGHTTVNPEIRLSSLNGSETILTRRLKDSFFKAPDLLKETTFGQLVKGMMLTPMGKVIPGFPVDLLHFLFAGGVLGGGLDLLALNIQRGRDHGIQGFIHYFDICNKISPPSTFDDFRAYVDPQDFEKLRKVYKNVDDIDFYIGMLVELPKRGSLVGQTIRCILADQFYRLKNGDRFFYENSGQPSSFTEAQLRTIRGLSLASVFCHVTQIADSTRFPFRLLDEQRNPLINCNHASISKVDFSAWKDEAA